MEEIGFNVCEMDIDRANDQAKLTIMYLNPSYALCLALIAGL